MRRGEIFPSYVVENAGSLTEFTLSEAEGFEMTTEGKLISFRCANSILSIAKNLHCSPWLLNVRDQGQTAAQRR